MHNCTLNVPEALPGRRWLGLSLGRSFCLCLFSFHIKVTGLKHLQEDAATSRVSGGMCILHWKGGEWGGGASEELGSF